MPFKRLKDKGVSEGVGRQALQTIAGGNAD